MTLHLKENKLLFKERIQNAKDKIDNQHSFHRDITLQLGRFQRGEHCILGQSCAAPIEAASTHSAGPNGGCHYPEEY
jgi:hypothetical protein